MSQDAPKIEFPCDYSLRIVGNAAPDFQEVMLTIVRQHAGDVDLTKVQIAPSRNGNYLSLRVSIVATSETQLQQLFTDLRQTGRVHTVL